MADYRRMVSYMYQYENGVKKKNVGFARVEVKGGQCKITLHMQLLGQLDSIFPTYLIQRKNNDLDLIYLGDAILKNQIMDSKLMAEENNVMDSGYALSDMGGLLLFLNDKVFFATEWDDRAIVAKEVLEALKPKTGKQVYHKEQKVDSFREETEAVMAKLKEKSQEEQLNIPSYMLPGGWKMVERRQNDSKNRDNHGRVNQLNTDKQKLNDADNADDLFYKGQNIVGKLEEGQSTSGWFLADQMEEVLEEMDKEEADSLMPVEAPEEAPEEMNLNQEYTDKEIQNNIDTTIEETNEAEGSEEDVTLHTEQNDSSGQNFGMEEPEAREAKKFFDHYPKIYPFEDNEIIHCVKIEPKDIGLMPKEIWPYSNNSFLLHSFYCYHHLIFAKMKNQYGFRYILGVPGIYHDREQFMARMFGFENFKSIRKRELRQGDFGYWYLPVYL